MAIRFSSAGLRPARSARSPSSSQEGARAAEPDEGAGRPPELRRGGLDFRVEGERRRGRGSATNATGRFEPVARERFDDDRDIDEPLPPLRTEVAVEKPRVILTRNDSPDVGFDRSINPYRGCEHGCVYCFARPTHAYQGLSAGLDFETRLFAKPAAAGLLEKELAAPSYAPRTLQQVAFERSPDAAGLLDLLEQLPGARAKLGGEHLDAAGACGGIGRPCRGSTPRAGSVACCGQRALQNHQAVRAPACAAAR